MLRKFGYRLAGATLTSIIGLSVAVAAQESETLTVENAVSGTMAIDFKTRLTPDTTGKYVDGSPKMGIQDEYKLDLTVADTVQFSGTIVRQPNIYTKTLRKLEQGAALGFKLDLIAINEKDPKQKKAVGKWVGVIPIDTDSGAYDLAGGRKDNSPLRIAVDAVGRQSAFVEEFRGRLVGKAEQKESLANYTYKRVIGNREVKVEVKRSDPMRFQGIELGKGPKETFPRTVVNGRLDYDYDAGNWYTDGIAFKYTFNGQDVEDKVTGSIKWVEDPSRSTNGKGYYEFNLRFNEEKNKTTAGANAAFEEMSEEDAFFAVDDSVPSLTGRIEYVDTFASDPDKPSASKVTFSLNANKLTRQQLVNFVKLWLICVGPTNDE